MAVLRKHTRREEQIFVEGDIPMEYVYTVGPTLEPFLIKLKNKGEFHGAKCDSCGTVYVPPSHFCEACFVKMTKSVKLQSRGVLESFTIAHFDSLGESLKKPEIWGLIRLNGADTPFIHRILAAPEKVALGCTVKVKLKAKGSRKGSMNDIEGFVPV
jgi:uncharacterized OB-fold protein